MKRPSRHSERPGPSRMHFLSIVSSALGLLISASFAVLGASILSPGANSLRIARHELQRERALFAAEAGLVEAAERLHRGGGLSEPLVGALPETGSRFRVTPIANATSAELAIRPGFSIPASSVYLEAEGFSFSGQPMVVGALFQVGTANSARIHDSGCRALEGEGAIPDETRRSGNLSTFYEGCQAGVVRSRCEASVYRAEATEFRLLGRHR